MYKVCRTREGIMVKRIGLGYKKKSITAATDEELLYK